MKEDKEKHVFGPRFLEKGQYGIFTIQHYGKNPAKIEIDIIDEEKNLIDEST